MPQGKGYGAFGFGHEKSVSKKAKLCYRVATPFRNTVKPYTPLSRTVVT